jgi:hypothetical protein
MKKIIPVLLFLCPVGLFAQFGLQIGLNFTNVTSSSDISHSNSSGFNAGIFLAPSSKSIFSSRTELLYSRQGYNYQTSSTSGTVNLDYITLPQYLCINITKYVMIEFGMQLSYLINAKADSSNNPLSGTSYGKILDYYNRFQYGLGGGVELHPYKGLLVGARVNFSLNNLYSNPSSYTSGQQPSFVPTVNTKNNLFQIFTGWRFGK